MSWTYNVAVLTTSAKDQVRRLIGDVIASDQQIQDEEIAFALTQRATVYGAAAECCRYIAAQYSRKSDVVAQAGGGALRTNYSIQASRYNQMALALESKSAAFGGGLVYAGGVSVADKVQVIADADRVSPQFSIGMEDNQLPVASIGNQQNAVAFTDDNG